MIKELKRKIDSSLKRFSDDTTIHGCKDLYYANYKWKFLWFFAIATAFCVAMYQTYQVIDQFYIVPTNTVVRRLAESPIYPPLKICIPRWVHWVDFSKVTKLGLDRPTFLYGMTFVHNVYVEIQFDVKGAKQKFGVVMRNFSDIFEYYKAISRDLPAGYSNPYLPDTQFTKIFDPWLGYPLCYSTTYSAANLYSQYGNEERFNFDLDYVFDYDNNMITTKEYTIYCHVSLTDLKNEKQLVTVGNETFSYLNIHLMADGTRDFFRTSYVYEEYVIKLSALVYHWMNKPQYPCVENEVEIGKGRLAYCVRKCYLKAHKPAPGSCGLSFANMSFLGDYKGTSVCTYGIYVINGSQIEGQGQTFGDRNKSNKLIFHKTSYKTCLGNCHPACKHWIYESSIVANLRPPNVKPVFNSSHHKTLVTVQYPMAESIVVYMEVPSQTWDTLLANVGGLLGLWMGGSVLSVVQLVYLCWCVQRKNERNDKRKSDNNRYFYVEKAFGGLSKLKLSHHNQLYSNNVCGSSLHI